MQLQIECSQSFEQRLCITCHQLFVMKQARVIVCNEQGKLQGDVCPTCLGKGFQWLNHQFERSNHPLQTNRLLEQIKVA
jgi:DnaJ-class molecular chaperone